MYITKQLRENKVMVTTGRTKQGGKDNWYPMQKIPFMDHSLVEVKWLVNSVKLWAMPCGAIQDEQVIVKSSGKMWSIGGGHGNSPWTARKSNQLIWTVRWEHWCSRTRATRFEQLTHWKRPWCWEGLKAGGEGGGRGWDGWMASPTQWTWIWANSGN